MGLFIKKRGLERGKIFSVSYYVNIYFMVMCIYQYYKWALEITFILILYGN